MAALLLHASRWADRRFKLVQRNDKQSLDHATAGEFCIHMLMNWMLVFARLKPAKAGDFNIQMLVDACKRLKPANTID